MTTFFFSNFIFKRYPLCEIILKLLFFVSPFCDAATGFLVLSHIMNDSSLFTPSQLVKFSIMILLFFQVYKSGEGFYKICLLCGYVIFLELCSCIFWNTSLYAFMYSIMQLYKVIYLMELYYFLRWLLKTNALTFEKLLLLVVDSGLIYAIILIVTTVLGINVNTYEKGNFGTKGIFASGNGLSLYLGFSSSLALYYRTRYKAGTKKFIILFVASTIVGTKASIIFLLINLLAFFYYAPWKSKILMIVIVAIGFSRLYSTFSKIFDVILYRMKNANSVFTFLASSRDAFVKDAFSNYEIDGLYSLRMFFGSGGFVSFRSSSDQMQVFDTLENDFFDVFFMYGCIMLFLYFKYILHYLYISFLRKEFFLFVIFAGVAGYSLIAGHTLFNSMSGTGLVVVPILILSKKLRER